MTETAVAVPEDEAAPPAAEAQPFQPEPAVPQGAAAMPPPEAVLQFLRQSQAPLRIKALRALIAVGVVTGFVLAPIPMLMAAGGLAMAGVSVATANAGRQAYRRHKLIKQYKKMVEERATPEGDHEAPDAADPGMTEPTVGEHESATPSAGEHDNAAPAPRGPKRTLKHLTPEAARLVRIEIATERFWSGQQKEAQSYRADIERILSARTLNDAAAMATEALAKINDKAPRCRENITYRWTLHEISKKEFVDSVAKARTFASQTLSLYGNDISVAVTGTKPADGQRLGSPYPRETGVPAAPATPAAAPSPAAAAGARLAAARPAAARSGGDLGLG